MMTPEPNEIRPELVSTLAMQPWKTNTSASRDQMVSSHLGQHLVVEGGTERYYQTGYEREFGRYTFAKRMPCNGHVVAVIERYARTYGEDALRYPMGTEIPQTVVIYQREDTKEIGYIDLTPYSSQHQYFGYEYQRRSAMGKLHKGIPIGEGEVFMDSPAISENGAYKYGVELNAVYLSIPAVSEDGILICEDVLERFAFKTYETRVVEWGSKMFPLNVYGQDGEYKPFPELGEFVREDGLLMALRTYDEMLAPIEQGIEDVKEVDPFFDNRVFAGTGGRIVDIKVHHQGTNPIPQTPEAMEAQVLRYDRARRQFYQEILDEWKTLKRGNEKIKLTPAFDALVREAISVVGNNTMAPAEQIRLQHRQNPLDEWRIEFVIEYRIIPRDGVKITDIHGGKGVLCQIGKPEEMPVDENGVRADVVFDGGSTVNRMNIGRLYEHYFNAAGRDLVRELTNTLGVNPVDRDLFKKLSRLENENPTLIDQVWNRLMGFYEILSPEMHAIFVSGEYSDPRLHHLEKVVRNKMVHIWYPTDNQPEPTNMVRLIEQHYRPHLGPVTYIGNSGRKCTTKDPARIGSVYVILLEKVADDGSAVSSGKYQHFGVLSQLTSSDKYSNPFRAQPVRAMGESEERIYVSYCGTWVTAELNDWNNNPFTHRMILGNLLSSEKPTAIPRIVDRTQIPLGGAKPLQLISHTAQAGGWGFKYEPPRQN